MKPAVLTPYEVAAALAELPGWTGDTSRIARSVRLPPDRTAAVLEAVQRAADAMDHHPVVDRDGDNVTFSVWTHWVGGVTAADFTLARAIDEVVAWAGGDR
jgi:4a-hydroxytetrahydrobiopterin dehydratase